jgi:hypothetical protein
MKIAQSSNHLFIGVHRWFMVTGLWEHNGNTGYGPGHSSGQRPSLPLQGMAV